MVAAGVGGPDAGHEEWLMVDDREVIITPVMYVRCDGGKGASGHPVEFMTLELGGEAICKYCGRRFVLTTHPEVDDLRERGEPTRPY